MNIAQNKIRLDIMKKSEFLYTAFQVYHRDKTILPNKISFKSTVFL